MINKDKKVLQKSSNESKSYQYQKGNVSLNFTLRSDIKQEMKDFIEILKAGIKDVEEQLLKIK